jgi:hypothetical protein
MPSLTHAAHYDAHASQVPFQPYHQVHSMNAYAMPVYPNSDHVRAYRHLQGRGDFATAQSNYQPMRRDMQRLQNQFGGLNVQQQGTGELARDRNRHALAVPDSLPPKPTFASPILDGQRAGMYRTPIETSTKSMPPDPRRYSASSAPKAAPTVALSTRLPNISPLPDLSSLDKEELVDLIKRREEQMALRIEAIGFEPASAWKLWNEMTKDGGVSDTSKREQAAPILGIRLLQKLDTLQRENDELEEVIRDGFPDPRESSSLANELKDAQLLIDKLDGALTASSKEKQVLQTKVIALEQALAAACLQRSSATSAEQTKGRVPTTNKRSTSRGGAGAGAGAGAGVRGSGRSSAWSGR